MGNGKTRSALTQWLTAGYFVRRLPLQRGQQQLRRVFITTISIDYVMNLGTCQEKLGKTAGILPSRDHRERLLSRRNSQSAHLPIQVAAFEAKQLGGAADIAVRLLQFPEDVLAFGGLPHVL
jgi:hypothetical protein